MDQDVTLPIAVEHVFRCPPHGIWIAQVNRNVAVAVQNDHRVVICQASGNRAADRARPARHDGNPPIRTGSNGHRSRLSTGCVRSLGGSRITRFLDARHTRSARPRLLAPASDSRTVSNAITRPAELQSPMADPARINGEAAICGAGSSADVNPGFPAVSSDWLRPADIPCR